MEVNEILKAVDHTLLKPESTWEQIKEICRDGAKFGTASVCIPPTFVKEAKQYLNQIGATTAVCTVIGFPNGYSTGSVKAYEAMDALKNGADEIDMVISIGDVKMGNYGQIQEEIRNIKEVCGDHILKVIIETCLLTDEEKIRMCQVVTEAGADYIKTSTGFSTGGATLADVKLFAAHVGPQVKIKAAGGISSMKDAEDFLAAGASRLGTSRVVRLMKENR